MTKKIAIKESIIMLILPILLVVLWGYGSSKGLVNQSILPAPGRIIEAFVNLVKKGTLQTNIIVSLGRIMKGFLLGTAFGIVLGVLMASFSVIENALRLIVGMLKAIPIIALIPFFILWLGIKEPSKIAIIFPGSFWPVLINTIQGVQSVDKKLIELSNTLNKHTATIVFKILIPSALPYVLAGIRLALSTALVCVVTAEMIAASQGLGYMIMFARELAQPDVMIVGIIIIGAIGLICDLVFLRLQALTNSWHSGK